jgi:hypothetical protein
MNGHRRTYTIDLEPIEGSDDLLLKFPEELLANENWRAGDVLEWEASPGRILFTNRSKRERERCSAQDGGGVDGRSGDHDRCE